MAKFRSSLAVFLLTVVLLQLSVASPNLQPCRRNKGMGDFLNEAGVAPHHANTYVKILKRNHIDETILPKITITQLQQLGITPYGDCVKIVQYFSSDTDECAASVQGNPCQNGGVCTDGFRCFYCSCMRDFYGPTCAKICPCRNSGQCVGTVTGFKCECTPGYAGILCEKQWLSEDRFVALESQLRDMKAKLSKTEKRLTEREGEIKKQARILDDVQQKMNVTGWSLRRVDTDLDKLAKIALHGLKPTYVQNMPICLPRNTKAIMISVFLNFWNKGGHAYLNFEAYQQGNDVNGKVAVINTHYQIYANTLYYELLLPWNTSLPDQMVFKVTGSYNTGGNKNWYKIKLVGYITV